MTFSDEQKAMLKAKLDPRNVKPPPKGKYGDYVEGWFAIAEANRIFGFDGWSNDTKVHQLGEPAKTGDYWRVNYRAEVRITAGDIYHDGQGFGQGIDKDIGQAHESALKEAETDAKKRALINFGYPFGLALYDKAKANVGVTPKVLPDNVTDLIAQVKDAKTTDELSALWTDQGGKFEGTEHQAIIRNAFNTHPLKKKAD